MELSQNQLKGSFLSLEISPPREPTLTPTLEKIEESGVLEYIDAFSVTDAPLSVPKYNSVIAGYRLQTRFQKPVITTITMRDRNKIGLIGELLGANDLGVTTILALTGDPVRLSPIEAKGVFEGSSLTLLELISTLNRGIDPVTGKEFKSPPRPITPLAVSNSATSNWRGIERKVWKKVEKGAVGIITQPVYDLSNGEKLVEIGEKVKKEFDRGEIILGFFPITSYRTAQFLKEKLPGVTLPDWIMEEMEKAHSKGKEWEREKGVEISRHLFQKLWNLHPKIHFMSSNRFHLLPQLGSGWLPKLGER
jgi:5,10-methylenetetrahydrofolate reductase